MTAAYRFAVCDDEDAQRDNLCQMVKKWAEMNGFGVGIDCFPSAEAFLFRYAEYKSYDILLLDIEMAEINGVELARAVRGDNKDAQIIFITGYADYIADGYDVEALHYLLKPVAEDKFFAVLGRAAVKLERMEKALTLDTGNESVRVSLREVTYVEVRRNYVTVHAKNDYTVKTSLGDIEKELDDTFFRVGRSFIINLRLVRKITRLEIFLADGSRVPLPRGHYDLINRALIERL